LNLGWAHVYRGLSFSAQGRAEEGVMLITQGLAGIRATGAVTGIPNLLMFLAEAYGRLGKPREGLDCLPEAAKIISETEERSNEAELHRVQGDLLILAGEPSQAEESYQQAITIAKQQGAKLFELRASLGLAGFLLRRSKRAEARTVLTPAYDWFTEGAEMPDLKSARMLLAELS
jgi:predicted ATPase